MLCRRDNPSVADAFKSMNYDWWQPRALEKSILDRESNPIVRATHTRPPPLTIITLPRCPDWATARDPVNQRKTEEEKCSLLSGKGLTTKQK